MAGLNKVMLIGRLGKDPEIRYSQQGLAVVNFSIATSEQWTDKTSGDRQEKTEWHRIVVFGKQAETCEKYLSKGSQIYIEGRLQTRSYEKDGQTHYTTEIVATNFQFLGGKSDTQSPKGGYQNGGGYQKNDYAPDDHYQGQTNPGMAGGSGPVPDDDIPF
ncbi:MAG: single-stranded DNA-binding protein [Proteobacteria bacterium]|nr:single-stranded DNA-binding protein [Pseudomonadota bacterium]MBU1388691.1 single-stranded DNA-binding protein [Pseudomonadota bacterium]MBU1541901.1 single-stranded DNA-binding protein [Pseudomonadota bacterium]MBU2429575.1 single-stranded DNA-binding protein [Pseudomonadota bacterium]MBU2480873.1 single-stranded DNA-binding protein [Pseudomonadota bacterium]